jgi:hypothetical protein
MVRVPAYCERCALLFPSGIEIIDIGRFEAFGNLQNCPKCGQLVKISEGVFKVADGVIDVVSGSDFTREMIDKFQNLIDRPVPSAPTEVQAIAVEADKIYPGLGRTVHLAQHTGMWIPLIALVYALSKCVSAEIKVDVDVNQLIDQLTAVESVQVSDTSGEDPKNE